MKLQHIPIVLALVASAALIPGTGARVHAEDAAPALCPVLHTAVGPHSPSFMVDGKKIAVCCNNCKKAFIANPDAYVTAADLGKCPVQGGPNKIGAGTRLIINNTIQYTCCPGCPEAIAANPSKYYKTLSDVVTKKSFKPTAESPMTKYEGQVYVFPSQASLDTFQKNPTKYAMVFGPKTEAK